jgi:hypothetical protein
MRTPQEIILEFKNVLYWSQPNLKHDEMLALINELETSLSPVEEPVVVEPIIEIVEEPTKEYVEDISESLSNILSLLETGATEEPIVEEIVAPKKTTTRKK